MARTVVLFVLQPPPPPPPPPPYVPPADGYRLADGYRQLSAGLLASSLRRRVIGKEGEVEPGLEARSGERRDATLFVFDHCKMLVFVKSPVGDRVCFLLMLASLLPVSVCADLRSRRRELAKRSRLAAAAASFEGTLGVDLWCPRGVWSPLVLLVVSCVGC